MLLHSCDVVTREVNTTNRGGGHIKYILKGITDDIGQVGFEISVQQRAQILTSDLKIKYLPNTRIIVGFEQYLSEDLENLKESLDFFINMIR